MKPKIDGTEIQNKRQSIDIIIVMQSANIISHSFIKMFKGKSKKWL